MQYIRPVGMIELSFVLSGAARLLCGVVEGRVSRKACASMLLTLRLRSTEEHGLTPLPRRTLGLRSANSLLKY